MAKAVLDQINSKEQLALSLSAEDGQLRKFLRRPDGYDSVVDAVTSLLQTQLPHEFRSGSWKAAAMSAKELVRNLGDRTELLALAADPGVTEQRLMAERDGRRKRDSLGEPEGSMFEVILTSSLRVLSRLLVDHAAWVVPEGTTHLIRGQDDLVRGQARIEARLDSLGDPVASDEQDVWTYTNAYLSRIHERTSMLKLAGIDLVDVDEPYPLSESYLNLRLTRDGYSIALTEPQQLLTAGHCVVLIGEPGGGKSTILQWLAMGLVREHEGADSPVPFLVKLRAHTSLPEISKLADPFTDGLIHNRPHRWTEDFIESGRSVLLLDGLDELPPDLRTRVIHWIEELLEEHGRRGLQIVLSTRPHAALSLSERPNFQCHYVQQMSPREIGTFIRRWWAATEAQRIGDRYVTRAELERRVLKNPVLADLARNPLLAAVLCSVYCVKSRSPSANRVDLYGDVTDMLLRRRDLARDLPGLSVQLTRTIAQKVAIAFVEKHASELPTEVVYDLGRRILESLPRLGDISHVALINQLLHRTYIIRSLPPRHEVDFWHNSFKEYLAACEVRDEGRLGDLMSLGRRTDGTESTLPGDDVWAEVRHWACAVLGSAPSNEIVNWLIDQAEQAAIPAPWGREALICGSYSHLLDQRTSGRLSALVEVMLGTEDPTWVQAWMRLGEDALELLGPALAGNLGEEKQISAARIAADIGGADTVLALAQLPNPIKARIADQLLSLWRQSPQSEWRKRLVNYEADRVAAHAVLTTIEELLAAPDIGPAYTVSVALDSRVDVQRLSDAKPVSVSPPRLLVQGLSVLEVATVVAYLGGVKNLHIEGIAPTRSPAPTQGLAQVIRLSLAGHGTTDLDVSSLVAFSGVQQLEIRGVRHLTGDASAISSVRRAVLYADEVDPTCIPTEIEELTINWPDEDLTTAPPLQRLASLTIGPGSQLSALDGVTRFRALSRLDVSFLPEVEHLDLTPLLGCRELREVVLPSWTDLSRVVVPEGLEADLVAKEEMFGLPLEVQQPILGLVPERWSYIAVLENVSNEELTQRGWTEYLWAEGLVGDQTDYERSLDSYVDGERPPALAGDDASTGMTVVSEPQPNLGQAPETSAEDEHMDPAWTADLRTGGPWPTKHNLLRLLVHVAEEGPDDPDEMLSDLRQTVEQLVIEVGRTGDVDTCVERLGQALGKAPLVSRSQFIATAASLDGRWISVLSRGRTD